MMQTLRVLMTTTPIGGVWRYSLELGGALARQGVRVILASMGMPLRSSHRRAVFEIPHVELAESAYKLEWMDDPWAAIDTAGEWLRTLVQRHGADVVHCNGFALAAVSFGVPVLCDAHSSIVVWARAIRGRDRGPEWDEYRARAAGGLRAAAEVVGPTRASLEAILDAHGVRRTGRVIPHGRSASAYRATYDELLAARRAPHLAADHGQALASSAALGSKPEL